MKNANISKALRAHMLDDDLLSGDYDKNYEFFLQERAEEILGAITRNITEPRAAAVQKFGLS